MSDHTAKISIAYPIEHIPSKGRVSKLSWKKESVQIPLRQCSVSELKLAFQIDRLEGAEPISIYQVNGNLWWPVGSNEQDKYLFLGQLRRGYQDVVGLIGARIQGPAEASASTK